MTIEAWLSQLTMGEFVEQYYQKLPYAVQGAAGGVVAQTGWQLLEAILDRSFEDDGGGEADLMVARHDQLHRSAQVHTLGEAKSVFADGFTIVVRHAERHHTELAALAGDFARAFHGPVDVHLYCTPAASHGFGWHYDAEEVFVVELSGSKEYSLRKNTVHPWPLVETIPRDMRFDLEQTPLFRCRLTAGDWLYIPNGYWHIARAEEDSFSLAIGVMSPAAIQVYDLVRPQLAESLLWRQRLPTSGEASPLSKEELTDAYRQLFVQLASDLARRLTDPQLVRQFLDQQRERFAGTGP